MKRASLEKQTITALLGLLLVPAISIAAHPTKAATRDDQINIIGHLPLTNTSVTSMKTSKHWRHQYLELQDPLHHMITVVDVTDAAHPGIVKQLGLPAGSANSSVAVLVGDVALLQGTDSWPQASRVSSVSVVSFTNPDHLQTIRTFNHVRAIRTDEDRGLIYLVNTHGLWVLQERPATDQKLQAEYTKYVLYDH